jgi:peptidoglycan hydrolase-like protein with peptidoglycan-binding domain
VRRRAWESLATPIITMYSPTLAGIGDDNLPLASGSKGNRVRQAQQYLNDLGYVGSNGQPLAVDGAYGANTAHAASYFNQARGLGFTPTITASTFSLLQFDANARRSGLATVVDHPIQPGSNPQPPAGPTPPAGMGPGSLTMPGGAISLTDPRVLAGLGLVVLVLAVRR